MDNKKNPLINPPDIVLKAAMHLEKDAFFRADPGVARILLRITWFPGCPGCQGPGKRNHPGAGPGPDP